MIGDNCKLIKDLGKRTKEFRFENRTILKDDKRNITITDREYRIKIKSNNAKLNQKWYRYTCNKCGWTEGWVIESALLGQNQGCSCCAGRIAVLGINTIWDTDRWMVDLGVSEEDAKKYTKNSHDKIKVTCPNCGRIKDKPTTISFIYTKRSIGCSCSDKISYPNKFAYSLLDQLNEIYGFEHLEHEYSTEWIKPKRYDNYFIHNGKEYILEMDGIWHKVDNKMNGQTKEESKAIDDYKDKIAKKHNIEVIRIDCGRSELEFIKQNILNSRLNELFDLNKIDWLKCEKFALSNFVKQACDLWNNGIKSTLEISKIIKVNPVTIRRYLKQGSLDGICNYNAKKERLKGSIKSGKLNGKQLEAFKGSISLGVFSSGVDLAKSFKKIFGVKLWSSAISSVCQGKQKHHKGFTFKYINEIEQAI